MQSAKTFLRALTRRKPLEVDFSSSQLKRCLTTFDLTALGIGSTLGLGIYVLAGQVASDKAGPAVTISFLVAAIASVFAGLCYAEFGARVPRAGSAYVYSYVTVGEFMAFIIGWNLILEYVIGTASVARGYSGYIDSLCNGTIQKFLESTMPIHLPNVSAYPDFLSFGITLFLTVMLAIGVKESSRFNNIFTGLNLLVVVFAIVAGSMKADLANWSLNVTEFRNTTAHVGQGGFFPFGFSGMMSGAATCFYGFIGFDCIATTGEEVKNPQKSIPISIVLSLLFIFVAYFGVSAVQTMMAPYYLQNLNAPLPFVFDYVGWNWAGWVISIGGLCGLSTSLLGAMFPLPRVLYAMATDGVIFRFFAIVHPKLKTPLYATIFSGFFAGGMAMMFNVHELADMMSIGTLLAYSLVAISVLILRYRPVNSTNTVTSSSAYSSINQNAEKSEITNGVSGMNGSLGAPVNTIAFNELFRLFFNLDRYKSPTDKTSKISVFLIVTICSLIFILDGVMALSEHALQRYDIVTFTIIGVLVCLIILSITMLCRQPVEDKKISFKVPFIPFIPILSCFVNLYLMFKLPILTWKRFGYWMAAGFCIYFLYGLWNSSERAAPSVRSVSYTVDREERHLVAPSTQPSIASPMPDMTLSVELLKSDQNLPNGGNSSF